jgi:hypothetical protein
MNKKFLNNLGVISLGHSNDYWWVDNPDIVTHYASLQQREKE